MDIMGSTADHDEDYVGLRQTAVSDQDYDRLTLTDKSLSDDEQGENREPEDESTVMTKLLDRQGELPDQSMGRQYSPESGSEGDDESDHNMDFTQKTNSAALMKNRYSSVTSSIDSLDDESGEINTAEAKIATSPSSNNNEVIGNTLPLHRDSNSFNIMPHPGGQASFLPNAGNGAPSSGGSSAGFSHNGRDTDSDNNRQRTTGDYHPGSISYQRGGVARPMHISDSFSPCPYCIDNQTHMLQHQPHHQHSHSHQGSCCGTLPHTPNSFSHYHQNIPHNMSRSQVNSKYQSGSYEPPWDLVYPPMSQLGMLQQQHQQQQHQHDAMCSHNTNPNNMCTHSNAPTATIDGSQRNQTHYRTGNPMIPRSASTHDRLLVQTSGHLPAGKNNNNGMNTIATTTGSHSYETPWDLGDSSKVLAYWQSRQTLRKLHGNGTLNSAASAATVADRHAPPPCSPPPPPPDALRRPVVHYDGAALAQANFVQQLPQKKPRRRCSWKCIGIFLMLAIVILAGCVAAFTVLLVDKDDPKPVSKSQGASALSGPVTDGNLGDRHRSEIPPYDFVKVRFYVAKSQFYKFNISLQSDAVLGVYGRRSRQPTHTQYEFMEKMDGQQISSSSTSNRQRRAAETTTLSPPSHEVNSAFVQYLDDGYWYLSFYNDGPKAESIRFTASRHDKMATNCANDCHGKGDCEDGVCRCYPGFRGVECNLNACPVLCSGNGVYEGGVCKCFDSWKGAECSIQSHHCESCVHGRCLDGMCSCEEGWKGERCDEVDCPVSDCSGHGLCHTGQCYCEMGYRGLDCGVDEQHNFTIACSNDCSGHGTFDIQLQTCTCHDGWQGRNCEEKQCSVECLNGHCSNGRCECDDMWGGVMCNEKLCDRRCALHGECHNGTCACLAGWNGKHCTLEGCPADCTSHGACIKVLDQYSCACEAGWKGTACDVRTELLCSDGVDNDDDNVVDCYDPDCCSDAACKTAAFCQLAPEPISILQRRPKLSAMASFYDTKKFLIEGDDSEGSIQRGANSRIFDENKVSVIRGTVLLKDGSPALGTRVEVVEQREAGFTLTRQNGTFDMMVNGGGSVTVRFIRGTAPPAETTVLLSWNTLVTLNPVTLLQRDDSPVVEPTCTPNHDRYKLYPTVLPTWQHSQLRACPETNAIVPESQVAQESLSIPGTNLYLLYKTSDSSGYKSTILIQLTPRTIPEDLALVHLRVSVEGVVYTEVFEADPNLTYRYAWQRKNAYHQNVYGIVTAHVSVGYEYSGCEKIFWDRQATTLSGYLGGDLGSSDRSVAKGWSLDIQHFYNYHEGILHKGDGTNIYLKEKPRRLLTVLGNGDRRDGNTCAACDGPATNKSLLAPVAIASDLDGAVYVADYNVIRRLSPNMEEVASVLELSGAATSYRYYMTVSPTDGKLYLTDFQNKQVLRVKETQPDNLPADITTNFEVIAGTGQTCVRGSGTRCGDGNDAKLAMLTNPKGITVNALGEIYFVDDTTIRKIGLDGKIDTVIGSQDLPGQYVPMPCGRAADLYEVFLGWPTSIAFSPVDGTLHILDKTTNLVLKVTPENKVAIVAGRPSHCPEVIYKKSGLGLLGDDSLQSLQARNTDLVSVKSMTFAPNGDLYIIESDERTINRVRVVSTDGYISHYAGGRPTCDCRVSTCPCWLPEEQIAAKALLNNPSSLTVTPDGRLYIADMGNLRVHSVVSILPKPKHTHYSVVSADDGQIYKFDRNGFHVQTTDIMTSTIMYNFTMYPRNSLSGALVQVTGRGGQVIGFNRNTEAKLDNITLNGVLVGRVRVNENRELSRFTNLNDVSTTYDYALSTGLLQNKRNSRGEVYFYEYDDTGRLTDVTLPTGEKLELEATVDSKGAKITLTQNAEIAGTATYNGNSLSLSHGSRSADVTYSNDGSIVVEYPSGLVVTLETGTTPTLSGENPTALKRKIISSVDGPVHRLEWRYYIRRQTPITGRKLRVSSTSSPDTDPASSTDYNKKDLMVNGENLLTLEYLERIGLEVVKSGEDQNLMQILYNHAGQPTFLAGYTSTFGIDPVNITYNSAGDMVIWKQGGHVEERVYNSRRQLESIKQGSDITTRYTYSNDGRKPTVVTMPTGVPYALSYDSMGNLIQIRSPGGQLHKLQVSMNIGFIRRSYSVDSRMYIEDYTAAGHMIRRIYPSEYRRVYKRYTTDGRPSEVFYDANHIKYTYDAHTHAMTKVKLESDVYVCVLDYKSNGSLYDKHEVRVNSRLGHLQFADVKYKYKYNRFLRVTRIQGTLLDGSRSLSFERNYNYEDKRGQLSGIADFSVSRTLENRRPKVTISDDIVQLIRRYDSANLLSTVEMKIGSRMIYQSTLTYDSVKRINSWVSSLGGSERGSALYSYNADSDVIKVIVDGSRQYQYVYNDQGSLTQVNNKRVTTDAHGHVSKYRNTDYEYDQDGFLKSRGNVKYLFNSQGQLTQVSESGRIDMTYHYDSVGRLLMRRDNYGSTVQLFYSNVMRPTEITHVYNFTSRSLYSLLYDDRGYLLTIDTGNSRHYVMTDHSGTPVAVYDRSGGLVKRIDYTVFGQVVSDTATALNVYLGFQGGFYDPVTELTFLSERWYDPQLGRWLEARLDTVFERVEAVADNPANLNGYQYQQPINLHLVDRNSLYMTDLASWLKALGYNLDVLAPRMTFEGRLTSSDGESGVQRALLPLVSAFQCAYEKDMDNFLELSIVPRSKLLQPLQHTSSQSLIPSGTLLSQGIVLSISHHRLSSHIYGNTPAQESLLATKVLNGSLVLGLNYTTGGKVTHHLLKTDLSALDDDMKTLGMQSTSSNLYLETGVRVKVSRSQYRDPDTNAVLSQGELSVGGNSTEITIRYGATVVQERARIFDAAAVRAVQYAWLEELSTVNDGRRSTYPWTSAEINQLKHNGQVTGYTYRLRKSADLYPELADDPSNIKFVKQ